MMFNQSKVYKKCPSVTQLQESECGPACLSMVLGYYGKYLSLYNLSEQCGVTRDGSKALTLIKVAESYGLELQPKRLRLKTIKQKQNIPCIAYWEYSHWIVIEGYDEKGYYINDPATGRRYDSDAQFEEGYSNISLTSEINESFEKGGDKWYLQRSLLTMFKPIWKDIVIAIGYTCTEVIPQIIIAFATGIFIVNVVQSKWDYWFKPTVSTVLLSALLLVGMRTFQYYIQRRLRLKVQKVSMQSFFHELLKRNVDFLDKRHPGEICSRHNKIDDLIVLLTGSFIKSTSAFIMLSVYLLVIILCSPNIGFSMLILLAFFAFLLIYLAPELLDKSNKFAITSGYAYGSTLMAVDSVSTVKAMGLETGVLDQWMTSYFKQTELSQEISIMSQTFDALSDFIANILKIILVSLGSILVVKGELQLSSLVAISLLIEAMSPVLKDAITYIRNLSVTYGEIARVVDVVLPSNQKLFLSSYSDLKQESHDHNIKQKEATINPEMKLRVNIKKDFCFQYSEQLKEVFYIPEELQLKSGIVYLIKGGRACGKTTLAKLLIGEIQSPKHSIKFEDLSNPNHQNSEEIESNIKYSYLDESNSFFPGPLCDSISFFNQLNNIEDFTNLIEKLGFQDLIEMIPGKLSYKLNASGTNISTRTLKMLEVCRSLLNKPNLIVFDYALDSLDKNFIEKTLDYLKSIDSVVILISRLKDIETSHEEINLSQRESS